MSISTETKQRVSAENGALAFLLGISAAVLIWMTKNTLSGLGVLFGNITPTLGMNGWMVAILTGTVFLFTSVAVLGHWLRDRVIGVTLAAGWIALALGVTLSVKFIITLVFDGGFQANTAVVNWVPAFGIGYLLLPVYVVFFTHISETRVPHLIVDNTIHVSQMIVADCRHLVGHVQYWKAQTRNLWNTAVDELESGRGSRIIRYGKAARSASHTIGVALYLSAIIILTKLCVQVLLWFMTGSFFSNSFALTLLHLFLLVSVVYFFILRE